MIRLCSSNIFAARSRAIRAGSLVASAAGLIAGGEAVKDLVNLAHTMRIRPEDEATSEPARIARERAEKMLEEHKRIKAEKAAADK